MQHKRKDVAVAVLVIAPEGIPLVRDPSKTPSFWKLPGGRGDPKKDKDKIDTGRRETKEETGLELQREDLCVVTEEDRENHTFFILLAELSTLPGNLKKMGNEGEEVRIFSEEEVMNMPLLPSHREAVQYVLLNRKMSTHKIH